MTALKEDSSNLPSLSREGANPTESCTAWSWAGPCPGEGDLCYVLPLSLQHESCRNTTLRPLPLQDVVGAGLGSEEKKGGADPICRAAQSWEQLAKGNSDSGRAAQALAGRTRLRP